MAKTSPNEGSDWEMKEMNEGRMGEAHMENLANMKHLL
jgi:hypothetical protein